VWRCGNRGNVASVLIEKPGRGDFLPIVDGGFALQFSPLVAYREGRGLVVFCQLDVTGRTETDPAAESLVRNMIAYVSTWKPPPSRKAVYAGDDAGLRHLEVVGIVPRRFDGTELTADEVLVVGPGGEQALKASSAAIAAWLKEGGSLLALGLDEPVANSFLPFRVRMKKAEHISAYFERFGPRSSLGGIAPADVHNRDPRTVPLLVSGAMVKGDGVLAQADGLNVVFCQLVPWSYVGGDMSNLRRTYRRSAFLVSRLLANMGVAGVTPLLERFGMPVAADHSERRWLLGLYLDQPEEWDNPYRFFRW
jgi:hypothetical protein